MDEPITCDFTSFSTVFHLYQDNDRVIIKRFAQWYPFTIKMTSSSWNQSPGPSYSKLTTFLVNILLKFQMLVSEICQIFFVEKM